MKIQSVKLPPLIKSLSARLLLLTIAFVMLAEVLIFTPSVGRFRLNYLEERIASAHLAILALEATPDQMVDEALEAMLLSHVRAYIVALTKPGESKKLMLMSDPPGPIDATYDLRQASFFGLIRDAVMTLTQGSERVLRVIGRSPQDPESIVELVMNEAPLRREMIYFGYRILGLSLMISLFTAALVYFTLLCLLVRPMRRLTEAMRRFGEDPEDSARLIRPSARSDEIGVAERHLANMQHALQASLHQKTRLAAVGVAVTKISHDLRNILSTAQLVSDRLTVSADPEVQRSLPSLVGSIDRAIKLCAHTLNFTREGPAELEVTRFDLSALLEEIGTELPAPMSGELGWDNRVPAGLTIEADQEQLYRVFHNLGVNAVQAGATRVTVSARADEGMLAIDFADNGPGLSPRARERLFEPFAASTRSTGTGLGLTIARELVRAHGGDIVLSRSDAGGTCFRLWLPVDQARRHAAQ